MSNLMYCRACGQGYLYGNGHSCPLDILHPIESRVLDRKLEDDYNPQDDTEQTEIKNVDNGVRKNKMKNKPCVCGSGKKFKKCCWHKKASNNE